MHCKANNDVFSILRDQLRVLVPPLDVLVAVLDGCTHRTTWELHRVLRDTWGLSSESGVRCKSNASIVNFPHHGYQISSWGFLFMRCLVVVHNEGRAVLCSLTNNTQNMTQNKHISQVEPRNRRNSGIYSPSSRLHLHSLFLLYWTHGQHPELSRHQVFSIKWHLSFQNTPVNLHNSVHLLRASFRYMQLYHNADASDVESFSTNSDGTKGPPLRNREG